MAVIFKVKFMFTQSELARLTFFVFYGDYGAS
jgi:hypothetical protein